MATFYARLINQYKCKYHILISASFLKINEEDQRSDEIQFGNSLNIDHKSTETDINNIDVKSQLEHQIQLKERKGSGWIFDKFNSMNKGFYKIGESNDWSYVRIPLRSNAILNIQNNDKYCFLWSVLT